MCRCCQSCLEELYWSCIEERFCYDETIAYYNPDEDEYFNRKSANGFIPDSTNSDNNNAPICVQPSRAQINCSTISSKIHEDEFHREIQTTVPILAPEILAVFANSQIFQETHAQKQSKNQPSATTIATTNKDNTQTPSVHKTSSASSSPSSSLKFSTSKEQQQSEQAEKLLSRLAGEEKAEQPAPIKPETKKKIDYAVEDEEYSDSSSKNFPSIPEENEDDNEGVTLRSSQQQDGNLLSPPNVTTNGIAVSTGNLVATHKRLKDVQSVPYFPARPASENDIFTISSAFNQISMTPEIPFISYSTLPKNYEDTPTIEKYRESTSLYSIQTANSAKISEMDFSMPRYFRRSDLFVQSEENVSTTKQSPTSLSSVSTTAIATPAKRLEKSKRLKVLRGALPPLNIPSHHKEKHSEKHKDGK